MPYLICPSCRVTSYNAGGHIPTDRCPHCDASLASTERAHGRRRWKVSDLRLALRQRELDRGTG